MSKFKRKSGSSSPEMNTASLPDIVFMLLFFFMVATTSKEMDPTVEVVAPNGQRAVDMTPFKQRNEIDFLYVGPVKNKARRGNKNTIAISLDNVTANERKDGLYGINDIGPWKKSKMGDRKAEQQIGDMITMIKIDGNTPVEWIFNIKEKLEEISAYKIAYSVKDNAIYKD